MASSACYQGTPENLDQAIYLLCRYSTAQTDNTFAKQAVGILLQLAILDMGRGRHALGSVRDRMIFKFHLVFEEYETAKWIKELCEDGVLQCHKDDKEVSMTRSARRRLKESLARGSSFQRLVFREWEREIRTEYPKISEEAIEVLIDDLRAFLARLAIMWSEEFLSSIYPDEFSADGRLDDAISDSLEELQHRDEAIEAIREKEFPGFILHATQERRVFLANLLDSAMVVCSLTIDPTSSKLVDQRISNLVLYTDTNFLIFLLGLSDPSTAVHARRLVELTIEAGVSVIVSQYTLKELREVIAKNRDFIIRRPTEAQLEAKERLSEGRYNLVTAYVLRCEELGVALSPYDFFNPFLHDLEPRLVDNGIIIEDTQAVFSPGESTLESEAEFLLKNVKHYGSRHELAMHDAYHKLLVDHLRGEDPAFGGVAQYWFLTCDYRLPEYAVQRSGSLGLPFCILSSAWLVFLRTMHPRTSDFALATSELLFQPALGLYDDIASELLKMTRAKHKHMSEFSLGLRTALPVSRLLENVIHVTQKEHDDSEEYEYDRPWFEEIASPAAAGLLTEDLRFKEAMISRNRELDRRLEWLSGEYLSISTRAKHLERVVMALIVWALLTIINTLIQSFFQISMNTFFFLEICCSLISFIIAIPWKKLTANQVLVIVVIGLFVVSVSSLLIQPFDVIWKVFLGLVSVAGLIRAIGQLIRWGKE